ncbi:MAG: transglycosylase SLT domain-containing protein [Bacillota bacterium]
MRRYDIRRPGYKRRSITEEMDRRKIKSTARKIRRYASEAIRDDSNLKARQLSRGKYVRDKKSIWKPSMASVFFLAALAATGWAIKCRLQPLYQSQEQKIEILESRLREIEKKQKDVDEIFQQAQKIKEYINRKNRSAKSDDIAYMNIFLAGSYGIDPKLLLAMEETESTFSIQSRGKAGEMHLMQIMPGTFKEAGGKNIFDWRETLECAVRHLGWLLKKHGGDRRTALAEYNAGERKDAAKIAAGYIRKLERLYFQIIRVLKGQ